jgi:hypothetical protein
VEPLHDAHATLVADLEAILHLPDGLAEILDAESGHVSLVIDLSVAIDTARGLADILDLTTPDAPLVIHATQSEGGAAAPGSTPARAVPVGPSVAGNLSRIRAALAHHRLLLRTARPHHYLESAMRKLDDIREYLARMTPDPDRTDSRLAGASAVLGHQKGLMARATAALADALPNRSDPQNGTADVQNVSDNRWLAAAGDDWTTWLWDRASGALRAELNGHAGTVTAAAIAPDGDWLVTAGADGTVRLWDPSTGQQISEPLTGHTGTVTAAAVSAGASGTASGVDRVVLAQSEQLLRQSADELRRLCLVQTMGQVLEALSDFRGADLRKAVEPHLDLEDLDGVRWSDTTAARGATSWPAAVHDLVVKHSVPIAGPETGVFVVQVGAAIGAGR